MRERELGVNRSALARGCSFAPSGRWWLPLTMIAGCAGSAPPPPAPRPGTEPGAAAALPIMSARVTTAEQPGADRCNWPERKGTSHGSGIAIDDAQVDVALLAVGLPPLSDAEKQRIAERDRIDDALEGTIGCEVSQARGDMPLSYFTWAVDEELADVAYCLYQPGQPRKERLVVRLSFDERGRPKHAELEPSKLDATASKCIETIFSKLSPASYQADPKTGEHATDELQANASARVELQIDMPAVR